jgi:FlaA1/EpsC-like NDP-sugar epimerase
VRAEDVAVETLLGRPIVNLDAARFGAYLVGRRVLVTGAGGSVGVELCARLARLGARELVLVDQAEATVVELARVLRTDVGFAAAVPVVADIKSRKRAFELFERNLPDVVFHAAANKHLPALEASPVEGVATNVLGTRYIVAAARRVNVDRFVLFSTDKAVRPTSVLGQTKAVAEWIVASTGRDARGRYASVRFGNVVDSAGSMLPIFRRQVAGGGPITVTDPRATRYLMTSGEAAGLAIVSGGLADGNRLFWLDSGPPVRVVDLARRLASTTSPDVAVQFVGLRAGERLHEQQVGPGEEIVPTHCERVWSAAVRHVDSAWLGRWLDVLERHVRQASAAGVRAALDEMQATPARGAGAPAWIAAR